MKITKNYLKQIINEELSKELIEDGLLDVFKRKQEQPKQEPAKQEEIVVDGITYDKMAADQLKKYLEIDNLKYANNRIKLLNDKFDAIRVLSNGYVEVYQKSNPLNRQYFTDMFEFVSQTTSLYKQKNPVRK